MRLVDIIILTGAACVSPVESVPGGTVAYKTPCAVLIYVPDANPFKAAQEQNAITVAPPPKAKAKKRKVSRLCGAKTAVWYVNKNNKRRYRCR